MDPAIMSRLCEACGVEGTPNALFSAETYHGALSGLILDVLNGEVDMDTNVTDEYFDYLHRRAQEYRERVDRDADEFVKTLPDEEKPKEAWYRGIICKVRFFEHQSSKGVPRNVVMEYASYPWVQVCNFNPDNVKILKARLKALPE